MTIVVQSGAPLIECMGLIVSSIQILKTMQAC